MCRGSAKLDVKSFEMHYYSTKNKDLKIGLKEALLKGLAPDGGLFMPASIPVLRRETLEKIREMLLRELSDETVSADVLRYFSGEFYYASAESDGDGFFIISVPRKDKIVLHVMKDGYFPFHKDIVSEDSGFQNIGRIKVFGR